MNLKRMAKSFNPIYAHASANSNEKEWIQICHVLLHMDFRPGQLNKELRG